MTCWLITSDLHLSDRPRDAYRFNIFKWLAKQQAKYRPDATFILGDITDTKDRHPASLVNHLVDELRRLKPPVYILKGNHDYIDSNNPFFGFLSQIDGIEFVAKPAMVDNVALIPHCQNQAELDTACGIIIPGTAGVFCHQTFEGAIAESGSRLSGLRASPIESRQPRGVWAGDVHRPQRCGPVTYIGSPYHVRFGDDYTPRVLLITDGVERNLYFPAPYKWVLEIHDYEEILQDEYLRAGDQVKVILELAREDVVEWAKHKQLILNVCKERELDVYGVAMKIKSNTQRARVRAHDSRAKSPEEVFTEFCQYENVASNIRKAGVGLLK